MPTSEIEAVGDIVSIVRDLKPESIMEIGPGFGKYGHLFREYLDLENDACHEIETNPETETIQQTGKGRKITESSRGVYRFPTRIDCCEAFGDYITPLHEYIYDEIRIGDCRETEISGYDLVTMIDVLEHLTLNDAATLIGRLIDGNGVVLVSVPAATEEQPDSFGNPFEIHKSQLGLSFFERFPHVRHFASLSLVTLVSNRPMEFKPRLQPTRKLKVAMGRFWPGLFARAREFFSLGRGATRNLRSI